MSDFLKIIDGISSSIKNKKILGWLIIVILIILLIFYPIIDANFLYYRRTKKRIEVLDNISKLDLTKIKEDSRLESEYESILNDIETQRDKALTRMINFESSGKQNLAKAIAASWIWVLVAIILIVSKGSDGKRFNKNNLASALLSIVIGIIFAWIATLLPIIVDTWITCALIQVVLIYLMYTISKTSNK